jgi:hypothetical protein
VSAVSASPAVGGGSPSDPVRALRHARRAARRSLHRAALGDLPSSGGVRHPAFGRPPRIPTFRGAVVGTGRTPGRLTKSPVCRTRGCVPRRVLSPSSQPQTPAGLACASHLSYEASCGAAIVLSS